jgi:hypothetical protein
MAKDKYAAVWVSHSSLSDWLACPRAYYLKNVYKDPKTGKKIVLMNLPLALGQAVHEVIENLSNLPVSRRFAQPLTLKFDEVWQKFAAWFEPEAAKPYCDAGRKMLLNLMKHPGPLANLAVKIDMDLPYFWLSEADNLILCGKLDWMEYLPKEDAVHIIDFKTGKGDEPADSLQLPIYYLLAANTQSRPVKKLSYWYLNRDQIPKEQRLPDPEAARKKIIQLAKAIKLARSLNRFVCPRRGCRACRPYEQILNGGTRLAGTDELGRLVFISIKQEAQSASRIL